MGKNEAAKLPEAVLSNEALEEWKDRIGLKLRISNIFNQTVSYETARNFVNGVGDVNPLYRDEGYARKTRYGSLVAPPSWLYSIFPTWVAEGLPGLHGFHSGNDWEFYKPISIGDHITPTARIAGFDVIGTEFSGRSMWRYTKNEYHNQRGDLVAKNYSWSLRAERKSARERGKYSKIQLPHPWTDEELAKIEDDVLAEKIRGAEVRYWEDTNVGDELPVAIRGPFGLTDMIAFCVGAGPIMIAAHGAMLQNYRRHPAWAFRDRDTCALEPIYAVHYNRAAALAIGLPYPYAVGTQEQCWLISSITNWMGDEGWLKRSYAEYRKFVYFSDVVWFRGKVSKKYINNDGEHCVEVDSRGTNQRGEDAINGCSTVVLPSKKAGTWPVDIRLPKKPL